METEKAVEFLRLFKAKFNNYRIVIGKMMNAQGPKAEGTISKSLFSNARTPTVQATVWGIFQLEFHWFTPFSCLLLLLF